VAGTGKARDMVSNSQLLAHSFGFLARVPAGLFLPDRQALAQKHGNPPRTWYCDCLSTVL